MNIPKPKSKDTLAIPKWYLLRARASLKKDIIKDLLLEYEKPVKLTNKQSFKPTTLDVQDYKEELYKLNMKNLLQIKKIEEAKPKLSWLDKASKLNKRKAMLVSIYHKNGSRTHYICSKYTRVIIVNEHQYLSPPNMGNYDNKYKMMSYAYYENNPFPIQFRDDYQSITPEGITIPDGELLKTTKDFEFAQRLAASNLKSTMNLALIFSLLAFVCSAATTILCLKGFNMI